MDNDKLSQLLLLYVHCELDKKAAEPGQKEAIRIRPRVGI